MGGPKLVPAKSGEHIQPAPSTATEVQLADGDNLVGRDQKTATVWIDDKRCSRKQAVLHWRAEPPRLSVTVTGTNPCFRCEPEGENPQMISKETKAVELKHGDIICLLALEFPYRVEFPSAEPADDDELMMELSGSEGDSDAMEDSTDDRPACQYGAKCYRGNPDHNRKFSHPHKDRYGKPIQTDKSKSTKSKSSTPSAEEKKNKKEKKEEEKKKPKKDVGASSSERKAQRDQLIQRVASTQEEEEIKPPPASVSSQPTNIGSSIFSEEEEEALEQRKKQKIEENNRKIAENHQKSAPARQVIVKAPPPEPTADDSSSLQNGESTKKEDQDVEMTTQHPYPHADHQRSLALVSLCVDSSSQFDGKTAVRILAKELVTFLVRHTEKDIRIQLIATTEQNEQYALGEELTNAIRKLLQKNKLPDDPRFSHQVVESSDLEKQMTCRFLVCPVTWRFKSNHPVTKALTTASPYVLQDAKKKHLTAECGKCYTQWLPGDSLFQDSVQAAFLVNGPNMHATHKPNCLDGDYKKGKDLYHSCVKSILDSFATAAQLTK